MATYYTIHGYIQEGRDANEDILNLYELYETLDDACDTIELEIKKRINRYNEQNSEKNGFDIPYIQPDREHYAKDLLSRNYVHYYDFFQNAIMFVVCRMTVKAKKSVPETKKSVPETCDKCENTDWEMKISPYDQDVNGIVRMQRYCNECYEQELQDI